MTSPVSTPSSPGHLTIRNLTKTYADHKAVDDVTLEVVPGEFFTLLGPSGSGKTTTMMAVAGFVEPDSGAILLDGERLDKRPVEDRNLGIVFQNYALFPHMTVFDNLSFPLEIRRLSRDEREERIRGALRLVGLGGREGHFPTQLSGGQQQRVAVARAMIFEPAILLMDEPLGALDKNMRAHLQVELREIQQRLGITTIYVTHDQDEAFTMSDRIAVMNDGQIQQIGTPEEIYESPASLFVANFVGENNTFHGTVEQLTDEATLVTVPELGQVRARPSTAQAGSSVTLTVRPEHMLSTHVSPDANQLKATVVTKTYAGNVTHYTARLANGDRCRVRLVNAATEPRFDVGQDLLLRFGSADVLVHAVGTDRTDR